MPNLSKVIENPIEIDKRIMDGSYFDEDYFERGRDTGKSYYQNYRWMPQRSFREAFAIIDYLKLNEKSYLLDVGCAKGFLVRALRELEIKVDGCDISKYALQFAPAGCWYCGVNMTWEMKCGKYTHAFLKDVLEHGTREQIINILCMIWTVAPVLMCIIPMGDFGKYRIPEYHIDKSHIIAENENWWRKVFADVGWKIRSECKHVPGIKDNWNYCATGNRVFVLER